jgi:transcription elongation factor Elf1
MNDYPDEYEKTVDYTCLDCDTDHEDVEVAVSGRAYVVKCSECGYDNEFEADDD